MIGNDPENAVNDAGDTITTGSIINAEGIAIGRNARVEIKRYGDIIIRIDSLEELPPSPGEPPYKGLAYYTETDKDIFFGREQLSDDLAARLQKSSFLVVAGASGSGKSSLLRAGIVPRLKQQNWLIHILTPTADPLTQLANSLTRDDKALSVADDLRAQLADNPQALRQSAEKLIARANVARLLLVIDQFEELYTQCRDEGERRAFIDGLLATARAHGRLTVLIGLRADFTGRLAEVDELRKLTEANVSLLGPLQQEDLVRVIAEPARLGGWAFVDGLVEQILSDVGQEPGRLPLLSHALLETWKRRAGHVLTLRGYRQAGGVESAIANTADATFNSLPPERRTLARDIFLALTEVGETGPDTRRTAQRVELDALDDPAIVAETLDVLAAARLITIGETIQVAHEVLIRRWAMLQGWLNESRAQLIFHHQLRQAATLWKAEPLDGYLYRDEVLERALERPREDKRPLTKDVIAFLNASAEAEAKAKEVEEHEREKARQDVRRELPFVMVGGAVGLGLSGYLMLTLWLKVTINLRLLLTVPFIVLGAIVGLLYAPLFDWALARAGSGIGRRRLAAALLGFLIYGLALCMLNIGSGGVNYLLLFALGGVWGIAAGLGRIAGPPVQLLRLFAVAMVCGGILAAVHLAVRLFGAEELLGGKPIGPPPTLLTFAAGVLLPLCVLLAEWMSRALGQRSLR